MSRLSNDELRAELSRRAFLTYGAALGALGFAAPSLLMSGARAAGVPDGEVLTGSHWGAFRAKVEGGRMVSITPWEKDPAPSHQLAGVLDSVYSPTRIKYPMVRRAYLEKGPGADPDSRGSGDFVRVSWDQAIDLVAKELTRVEKTYGPAATFAGSYGWKSPGRLHNCQSLLRRMMNLKGSFVNASGDYSTGAAQIILPHVLGTLEVYEQQTVWPVVVDNTELMVFWGADPVLTNQISWVIADHGAYPGLKALKDKGTKVICIDPVKTDTAEFFGAEWIAPRPQTDVALMLGIAHTLVDEKLVDEKFLKTYTTGFDKFLPYLMGDTDKTPKTAEWAAAITRCAGGHDQGPCASVRQEPHDAGRGLVAATAAIRRAAALDAGDAGGDARPDRPAGRRLRLLVSLRERRRALGRRPGADRHHRRRQSEGRRGVADRKRRGLDPGGARRRHAAEPRQGVRLQRSQSQVPRCQDGLLGRRQSVRPSSGPQPHGRGLEEARHLHRPGLPVDADRALRRHRAAGDDLL